MGKRLYAVGERVEVGGAAALLGLAVLTPGTSCRTWRCHCRRLSCRRCPSWAPPPLSCTAGHRRPRGRGLEGELLDGGGERRVPGRAHQAAQGAGGV